MAKKKDRFIRKKTVRGMYNWWHYIFRQRLLVKAELVPGCTIIECDEPYTSKTCGACGSIHKNLGGRKVFACPKCGYRANRDASAARNIMLRYPTIHNIHV